MIRLTVSRDGRNIELRVLEPGSYTLGRSPDSDLVLDDPAVAERQLKMTVSPHGLLIEDIAGGQGQLSVQSPLPLGPFVLEWQADETEAGSRTKVTPAPAPTTQAPVLAGQPPAGPQAQLKICAGEQAGQVLSVGLGVSLVGRAPECQVRLNDPSVSRKHAELILDEEGLSVRDLGSTSGTLLGGRSVEISKVAPGQSLSFGAVTLEMLPPQGQDDVRAKAPATPEPEAGPWPEVAASSGTSGSATRRRLILYGAAGCALLLLALALVFGSGSKSTTVQVSQAVQQRQQSEQEEQRQRLVIINLTKGKQALEAGAHAEAAQFLRNVISADPGHEEAKRLLEQASQAVAQAEGQKAVQERQEAQRRLRQNQLLAQANAALEQEDFERVRGLAGQALEADPNDTVARHLIFQAKAGQEQSQRNRLEVAENARQREAQAQELYRQGQAKLEKKNLLGARQDLEQALALDSENAFAVSAQVRQALERADQATRKKADELVTLGNKQHKAGHLSEALGAFQQALQLAPDHPQASQGLAKVRQEAERQATRLVQEADVLDGLGKRSQACAKWRQALKLTAPEGALHKEIKEKLPLCR